MLESEIKVNFCPNCSKVNFRVEGDEIVYENKDGSTGRHPFRVSVPEGNSVYLVIPDNLACREGKHPTLLEYFSDPTVRWCTIYEMVRKVKKLNGQTGN